MNILLISHFFPPHKGGVETAAYNTAKKLAEKGHKVVVITTKVIGAMRHYDNFDGIHIYRYKCISLGKFRGFPHSSSLGLPLKAILNLKKIIKKYDIQVINLQGRLFLISVISALLNLLAFKKKMILTVQGRLKIGLSGILEDIFDHIITKFVYTKINKIVCVSNALKRRLLQFKVSSNHILVIPNGFDTELFKVKSQEANRDTFFNFPNNKKKILFAGRLDLQKGVEYLIRAIPEVIRNFPKVEFLILGNGKLENRLRKLVNTLSIHSHVKFVDMIPLTDMPIVYSSVDIFCLPSIHEGFPLSLIEAISMGLVVVASNTGGIPEVIRENENGFLFQPKNVNELTAKLVSALKLTDNEISQIHKNNIQKAQSKYSWDIITEKLIKLYNKAI
jgi:glycosyltransferase involved in cell wall biosynthesis